jgi:hypothetical protein
MMNRFEFAGKMGQRHEERRSGSGCAGEKRPLSLVLFTLSFEGSFEGSAPTTALTIIRDRNCRPLRFECVIVAPQFL